MTPWKMQATCAECGDVATAGCVWPWVEIEDGETVPADDVSYRCSECGEVTEREIEILEKPV